MRADEALFGRLFVCAQQRACFEYLSELRVEAAVFPRVFDVSAGGQGRVQFPGSITHFGREVFGCRLLH